MYNGMNDQEQYMWRCLELAGHGLGRVSPNPMVGAVIVHQGRIIGEGYHQYGGGAHAEVNAIARVKDKQLLKDSTLYVSLEPCSHHGKTPPCTSLILDSQIPRVVVACVDPFEQVAGNGIRILREAGVEVVVGVLEQEAMHLNRRFFCSVTQKRPYIILKWAETLDGFIAPCEQMPGQALHISSESSKYYVHRMRAQEDTIMVGVNTVLLDNPRLDLRYWGGKNPARVIIDRQARVTADHHVLNDCSSTYIYTQGSSRSDESNHWVHVDFNENVLSQILQDLTSRGLQSVIVEGGKVLLQSFIDAGLWDEAHQLIGNLSIGQGLEAPQLKHHELRETSFLGSTHLHIYTPEKK